jgi:hypothetical protein
VVVEQGLAEARAAGWRALWQSGPGWPGARRGRSAGNWAAGIVGALAAAWGRNARLWPTAIAVADLRDILTAADILTIAIAPARPSQAKASRGGHDPDGRPLGRTHRVLAAALIVISADPAYSGSHSLDEAVTACTPRPDLEPALSVRLAAAAARLALPAVSAPDRRACERAIAAAVRWCDQRTGEAAEAAGHPSAAALMDADPAADAPTASAGVDTEPIGASWIGTWQPTSSVKRVVTAMITTLHLPSAPQPSASPPRNTRHRPVTAAPQRPGAPTGATLALVPAAGVHLPQARRRWTGKAIRVETCHRT